MIPIAGIARRVFLAVAFAALFVPTGSADNAIPVNGILKLIEEKALTPPPAEALQRFEDSPKSREDLDRFLGEFDSYAKYLTAAEYRGLLDVQRIHSDGVGMDLVRNKAGDIVCIPYPDSSSANAGIKYADTLLAVDGNPVTGAELDDVAVLIRGEAKTRLTLTVAAKGEGPRTISLQRERLSGKSTAAQAPVRGIPRIRIYRFGPETFNELKSLLAASPSAGDLIIDLRGNTGGDMRSAIDCAKLFLPASAPLARIATRQGVSQPTTDARGPWAGTYVFIWQDELTASASEIFIAALRHSLNAETIGKTSAGKAVAQEVFRLDDGSILKLTTERLFFPDSSHTWQDAGIEPDFAFYADQEGSEEEYERLTGTP